MKIQIKTLQQTQFPLEIEDSTTVSKVKGLIHAQSGHAVDSQKLIFSGKILVDDKPLSEYGVKEGDFFVLMVSKPKTSTAPVTSSASSTAKASSTAAKPAPASSSTPVAATSGSTAAAPSTTTVPAATGAAPTSLVTGPEYESAVANLLEMGFDKESIQAAMRAAFNNPDRAVEYLMNGILAGLGGAASSTGGAAPTAGGATAVGESEMADELDMEDAGDVDPSMFSALSQNPQLQQLRQLVQTQPHLLEPILQQLGQSSPQLLQIISQNPGAFMSWLSGEGEEGGAAGVGGAAAGGAPPGATQIQLTQPEMDAVNRLTSLGFDRNMALEAYLACDKNEEMAANYLFDNSGDFQ